jgi:hypothetical protein
MGAKPPLVSERPEEVGAGESAIGEGGHRGQFPGEVFTYVCCMSATDVFRGHAPKSVEARYNLRVFGKQPQLAWPRLS